jgi:hypothetical protein
MMNIEYVVSLIKSNWKWLLKVLFVWVGIPVIGYYKPFMGIILCMGIVIYQMVLIRFKNEYIRELEEELDDEYYHSHNDELEI